MIKDLAVSYNGSANADSALRMAIQMCEKYTAMLTALNVSPPVRFEGKIERWISSDVMDSLKNAEDNMAESIHQTYVQEVESLGFNGPAEWIHEQGHPTEILTRYSRYFDLLLMGQMSNPGDKNRPIRAEDIVTRSGKPLLIVPNGYQPRPFTEHAVVAWDGSRAAARALTDAMQILETKRRLDVVTITADVDSSAEQETPDVDIVRHLRRHGIDARRVMLQASKEGKGATILDYCAETNPDILVTGAYGHSRLRENLFGGVTQHIMRHMNVPVFTSS